MLNFLSFLVLLYVSGHFQQKKFSKYFRLIENFWPVINSCCLFWTWKFYKCFSKIGGNLSFFKNVEFLEFFGFTLCFRTFPAKKNFSKFFRLIEKFWPVINSCCLFWTWKFYKCFSKIGGKFKFFQKCWISWVFWFYFMFQEISSNFFSKYQCFYNIPILLIETRPRGKGSFLTACALYGLI